MKVKIFYASMSTYKAAKMYREWIEQNQHVIVVSTCAEKDMIVVTYTENN